MASPVTYLASGFNTVLGHLFDSVAHLLALFPAGAVNDLFAGAVLLARRAFFIPVQLDGSPTITSVNLANAGTYGTNGELKFIVNFTEQVDVTNTDVALPVEIHYELMGAHYVSGSGTQSLLFSMAVPANLRDLDGIELGMVSPQNGVRVFDFGGFVVEKADHAVAADNAIPAVNTSRIRVDAIGPQITGRSELTASGYGVSLTVAFDGPVCVTGTPTVPVTVNGVDRLLTYAGGARTGTLTFHLETGAPVVSADFRPYVGDVIYLPQKAEIRDKLGNKIYTLEGNLGVPLIEDGNRLAVIGQHFEQLGSLTPGQLNDILAGEQPFYEIGTVGPPFYGFVDNPSPPPDQLPLPWPFLSEYDFQAPVDAENGVDIYRVSYRSSIPSQQRFTTAYGIVALPTDATGQISVVEWQQPTVFNLPNSAPSLAFTCYFSDCNDVQYENQKENDFPRFDIAQFAGQGYAVIMPDTFGLGNSPEQYAYQVKGSNAQGSLDMYNASMNLLKARNLQADNLFLAGWSFGGNQTASFLELMESQGNTVAGAMIASAPLSLGPAVRTAIFSPRPWPPPGYPPQDPENTGDAVWLNAATAMSAFSLGGYEGLPLTAYQLLGKNYDAGRRFYTHDYIEPLDYGDPQGITIHFKDVNGVEQKELLPYGLANLIVPQYAASPQTYDTSSYAQLMNANGEGRVGWVSPVQMYYGQQDEVLSVPMGESVYYWQTLSYGKANIGFTVVNAANHRGTYLAAMLRWFDLINA